MTINPWNFVYSFTAKINGKGDPEQKQIPAHCKHTRTLFFPKHLTAGTETHCLSSQKLQEYVWMKVYVKVCGKGKVMHV